MTRENTARETVRAAKFVVSQIKKGWTPEEAFNQAETSYGWLIKEMARYQLAKELNHA